MDIKTLLKFSEAVVDNGFEDVGEFVELIGGVMGMINLDDIENAKKISGPFAIQIGHILSEIGYTEKKIEGKTMQEYYEDNQVPGQDIVTFEDLLGCHKLSGVEMSNFDAKDYCGGTSTVNCCKFKLDGKVHVAVEDPEDGYRSCLGKIFIAKNNNLNNEFREVEVCGHINVSNRSKDLIEFIDTTTGLTVLEVGTDHTDDYYPCYVASFHPENMIINKEK